MPLHDRNSRSEPALITEIARKLPKPPAWAPFGDDMAFLAYADADMLWTTDMLLDGVHFNSAQHDWPTIGRKAMAVNLSDVAAMAAVPITAICAFGLGPGVTGDDALRIIDGMVEVGAAHGCELTGGDTNRWNAPTVISVAVAARRDGPLGFVLRSGAQPDNDIWLTGPVGGSLLGRHLRPAPRIALARRANRRLRPTAMIDISDGLSLDLWRLCEASNVGAALDSNRIEAAIHADARKLAAQTGRSAMDHALSDGEDFELIITLPRDLNAGAAALGLIPIGRTTVEPGLRLDGAPLEPRGWDHLA
ncbi:MAG: thiamine-monophosphate kinase [Phycisphaerales bacterium]|nr:thiamine-monophosphate kinase [Phycisphaerales bacterium]